MGRIKDLRAKVKDGSATDDEKRELDELEGEAADKPAAAEGAADNAAEGDASADEKSMLEAGKKLAAIAMAEFKGLMNKDDKRAAAGTGDVEKNDEAAKLKALNPKEKMKAFFTALLDNDKTKLDHLSTTSGDGGYLVPADYADTFVEDRRNLTVMRRSGATVVRVVGETFNIPQLATRPKVSWSAELAAKSSTSASWTNISLTPYTLAAYMTASNQVISSARIGGNLVDVITRLLTQAIAEAEDTAFFNGSGSGQPTGLTGYSVTQIDAQFVLSFTVLNNAKYRLGQGYRPNAKWFMNSRVAQVVTGLLDTQNRPIFSDAYNEDFPRLLGKPLYEQDDIASAVIWYGDPSTYWIGDKDEISVRVSDVASVGGQSAFERNFTVIRVEERVDGELADPKGFVNIVNTGIS